MISVDAIKKSSETDQIPLKWVGMEAVILPVKILISGVLTHISCEFDVFVNLVKPSKGVHMSRLYDILSQQVQNETLTVESIRGLLNPLVESQKGLSTQAKISMSLILPISVATLKSEKKYFKSVPLKITCQTENNKITTDLDFLLEYSSTCPQSAALAHQLTIHEMEKHNSNSGVQLTDWYNQNGFVATPHAQRSELTLSARVQNDFELSSFSEIFLGLNQCLGTPTQGLVKRVDEQEFARLNAQNLMFCEDAARKVILLLKSTGLIISGQGKVSHLESLHSHNAVAFFEC